MIGWIILIVYVVGWVFTARVAAVVVFDGEDERGPMVGLLYVLAGLVALLWPLIVPCYFVGRAGKRHVDERRKDDVEP